MNRKALNPGRCLGFFYDGCRDQVTERPQRRVQGKKLSSSGSSQCQLVKGNKNADFNLLQMIGAEDELRLSLLLRLTKRTGIAAALNHFHCVDDCTRFLYYSWINRTEKFYIKNAQIQEITGVYSPRKNTTHVITKLSYGIDLVVVFQLPSEIETLHKIDGILEKIRYVLDEDQNDTFTLTFGENDLLQNILRITVYSNVPGLIGPLEVSGILHQINILKSNTYRCHPVTYTLQPITPLYPNDKRLSITFCPLPIELRNRLEQYMLRVRNKLAYAEACLKENLPELFCGHLQHQLKEALNRCSDVKQTFIKQAQRFSTLVVAARHGRKKATERINQAVNDYEATVLKDSIDKLTSYVNALEAKGQLITDLRWEQFEYLNVADTNLEECDDLETIKRILLINDQHNRALCSNDTLNQKNESRLIKLRRLLTEERDKNRTLRLIYLDFSYSSFSLHEMVILQSDKTDHSENYTMQKTPSPINVPKLSSYSTPKFSEHEVINIPKLSSPPTPKFPEGEDINIAKLSLPPTPKFSEDEVINIPKLFSSTTPKFPEGEVINIPKLSLSPTPEFPEGEDINIPKLFSSTTPKFSEDKVINILLLGETGVGKSTFINAFANYLTFSSLEEAQSYEPIVLIPVSFIMTVGDDFEEETIKFGEFDSSNNEDFNTVGQSVTQHCKSYVFNLNENGQKLRIIDTPGFGDTRGLDQDDQNMEYILQYISNLTYLNAICFLLTPNSSRLNMFFRTCLTQLFSFLAPTARDNVIFCFTNTRSTFYTPGDTAPLLKDVLASSSISGISFRKENTFCFDSESFLYLVALQNDISFNNEDKQEYETSWTTSVKEFNRLVDYIHMNLRPYEKGSGWQSIKDAQFQISYMVRPMLETMRNILRNLTFRKNNLSNQFIELSAKAVHHTATRCLSCKPEPHQIGKFLVLPTVLHEIQENCCLCTCPLDQHVPIDYTLEYQCWYDASDYHKEATNNILEILCNASAKFAHFLMFTAHSVKFDPFLIGLKEMIDEENRICQSQKFDNFNSYLVKKLTILQELYEFCIQKITERKSNKGPIDLPAIYRSIDNISKYPMLHEQMVAVKQSQQMMMEDYECEVQAI